MEVETNEEYQNEKVEVEQVADIRDDTQEDVVDNQAESNIENDAKNGETQAIDDGEESNIENEATNGETQGINDGDESNIENEVTNGETQARDDGEDEVESKPVDDGEDVAEDNQELNEIQDDNDQDNDDAEQEAVDSNERDAEAVDVDTADDNAEDVNDINTNHYKTKNLGYADDIATDVNTTDVDAIDDDVVEEPAPTPVKEENKENAGSNEQNNNNIRSSISKFGAPAKKEKGMFKVVQSEKCAACQKTVYAMEKLEMNGHIYHKNCFKCSHCSARLTPKTFSMNEGVIYCVNHFKQLFARKGNYDEGFGRQQYKKKWGGEKKEGATP